MINFIEPVWRRNIGCSFRRWQHQQQTYCKKFKTSAQYSHFTAFDYFSNAVHHKPINSCTSTNETKAITIIGKWDSRNISNCFCMSSKQLIKLHPKDRAINCLYWHFLGVCILMWSLLDKQQWLSMANGVTCKKTWVGSLKFSQ